MSLPDENFRYIHFPMNLIFHKKSLSITKKAPNKAWVTV